MLSRDIKHIIGIKYQFTAEYDRIQTLTQRGRVTNMCVIKLAIIGSDNGLLPGRHQAII